MPLANVSLTIIKLDPDSINIAHVFNFITLHSSIEIIGTI